MNPDPHAKKVWESLLPEIRRKRRQRNAFKLSAVSACFLALVFVPFAKTRPLTAETTASINYQKPTEPVSETLAVMRVGDDGVVRLEEIGTDQLGSIELAFGLTPLISNADLESNSNPAGLEFH